MEPAPYKQHRALRVTARRESCHELCRDWMGAANQDYKRDVHKTEAGQCAFCVLRASSVSHQRVNIWLKKAED